MTAAQEILAHNRQFRDSNRDDLELKIASMRKDVYPFFRATAHLFYRDMAALPSSPYTNAQTGRCWLAGDAHPANFGSMRDAGGGQVFAVSDFDEAYPGQYLWDLRRLAVGLLLAPYATALEPDERRAAIAAMATAYLACMEQFQSPGAAQAFRLSEDNTSGIVQKTIKKGAKGERGELLAKFQDKNTGALSQAKIDEVVAAMPGYVAGIAPSLRKPAGFYEVLDVGQRFGAGMGSLGKLRYYALLRGGADGQVLLELKQAIASAVAQASPGELPEAAGGGHEGRRIALAQQAMLPGADPLAGYATIGGLPFYVHEKAPTDKDFKYEDIATAAELNKAAASLGMALASAHALTGQNLASPPATADIAGQIHRAVSSLGGFLAELTGFADSYAAKARQDWQDFDAAVARGEPMY